MLLMIRLYGDKPMAVAFDARTGVESEASASSALTSRTASEDTATGVADSGGGTGARSSTSR